MESHSNRLIQSGPRIMEQKLNKNCPEENVDSMSQTWCDDVTSESLKLRRPLNLFGVVDSFLCASYAYAKPPS